MSEVDLAANAAFNPEQFSHLGRGGTNTSYTPTSGPTGSKTGSKSDIEAAARSGLNAMISSSGSSPSPPVNEDSRGQRQRVRDLAESVAGVPEADSPHILYEGKDPGLMRSVLEEGDVIRHKTLKCLAEVTKVKGDGTFIADMVGVGKLKVRLRELANYERIATG